LPSMRSCAFVRSCRTLLPIGHDMNSKDIPVFVRRKVAFHLMCDLIMGAECAIYGKGGLPKSW